MDPKQKIDLFEFSYYADALDSSATPECLQEQQIGQKERSICTLKTCYPAYCTSVLQLDSCRLAGQNEIVFTVFSADKFGVSLYPHAGEFGLC